MDWVYVASDTGMCFRCSFPGFCIGTASISGHCDVLLLAIIILINRGALDSFPIFSFTSSALRCVPPQHLKTFLSVLVGTQLNPQKRVKMRRSHHSHHLPDYRLTHLAKDLTRSFSILCGLSVSLSPFFCVCVCLCLPPPLPPLLVFPAPADVDHLSAWDLPGPSSVC